MKKKIEFILTFIFCFTTIFVFGQTGTTNPTNWIAENWEKIAAFTIALYELVVRFFPTANNWSILTIIMRIIRGLVPNFNQAGGAHDEKL